MQKSPDAETPRLSRPYNREGDRQSEEANQQSGADYTYNYVSCQQVHSKETTMAQDLIHNIDDHDRELARNAADRTSVKASMAHEIIVQQLIEHGLSDATPYSDKLAIARELKDITAVAERAKRQVAAEGAINNSAPTIHFNFPSGAIEVIEVAEITEAEFSELEAEANDE
jgi:hypothetical protein